MTKEEREKSVEFKIINRALKQRYPYLIGVEVPDDTEEKDLNYPGFIFIDMIFSLEKLLNEFPYWEAFRWTIKDIEDKGFSDAYYLGSLVNCADEENCPTEALDIQTEIIRYGEKVLENTNRVMKKDRYSSVETIMTNRTFVVK